MAIRRWAGMGVIWDATEPEPSPPPPPPQVSLTVIHVAAGAFLNVGGLICDPRLIPAVSQQRAAVTEGNRRQAVGENGNGGAQGVTDDKWAEQQQNNQEGR